LLRLDSSTINPPPPVGISDIQSPAGFELGQNHPNPFNHQCSISYRIASPGFYKLNVYDLSGRIVLTLVDGKLQAGQYKVNMDADKLSPGTYFNNLSGKDVNLSRKMILMNY